MRIAGPAMVTTPAWGGQTRRSPLRASERVLCFPPQRGIISPVPQTTKGATMDPRSPDELLTTQQVCDELQGNVTPRTVMNWCKTGRLRATRAGWKWLIRRADLEAFLRQGGEEEQLKKANALAA